MASGYRTTLRRLTILDDRVFERILGSDSESERESQLGAKTHALVRIGALVAMGASAPSFRPVVDRAREAGATDDEIVGALIAVATATGAPRVVTAAPKIALAMGYDVDSGLEELHTLDDADLEPAAQPDN